MRDFFASLLGINWVHAHDSRLIISSSLAIQAASLQCLFALSMYSRLDCKSKAGLNQQPTRALEVCLLQGALLAYGQ